jgi:hypothetical protein
MDLHDAVGLIQIQNFHCYPHPKPMHHTAGNQQQTFSPAKLSSTQQSLQAEQKSISYSDLCS